MKVFFWLFLLVCCLSKTAFSQDILYTTKAEKLLVKIVEIEGNIINYLDFNNLEGASKYISKIDIVMIQYANGVKEIVNYYPSDAGTKIPIIKNKKKLTNKLVDINELNKNMISINGFALANGDLTLMYDRELFNNKVMLSFLGGYNLNSRMGIFNSTILDSKDAAKKKLDVGLGINYIFFPKEPMQYFTGILAKHMTYSYEAVVDTVNNAKKYLKSTGSQTAILFTNGCLFRISPNFNLKVFASIGVAINSTPLKDNKKESAKMYLGYCFGYRF